MKEDIYEEINRMEQQHVNLNFHEEIKNDIKQLRKKMDRTFWVLYLLPIGVAISGFLIKLGLDKDFISFDEFYSNSDAVGVPFPTLAMVGFLISIALMTLIAIIVTASILTRMIIFGIKERREMTILKDMGQDMEKKPFQRRVLWPLLLCVVFPFLYIFYYHCFVESVYYEELDFPVLFLIATLCAAIFLAMFIALLNYHISFLTNALRNQWSCRMLAGANLALKGILLFVHISIVVFGEDYFIFILGGILLAELVSVAALARASSEKMISKVMAVLGCLGSFLFGIDVVIAIVLYWRVRKLEVSALQLEERE